MVTSVGTSDTQMQALLNRVHFDQNSNMAGDADPLSVFGIGTTSSGGSERMRHKLATNEFRPFCGSLVFGASLCCSCLFIGEVNTDANPTPLLTAAEVSIGDCTFARSKAMLGGCLYLGILKSLLMVGTTFDQCRGTTQRAAHRCTVVSLLASSAISSLRLDCPFVFRLRRRCTALGLAGGTSAFRSKPIPAEPPQRVQL